MRRHFPDAEVTGCQHLIDAMENEPKDRHVLAAAVWGGAELLVTENLKDFPDAAVSRFGIEVLHQDEFLLDQFDLAPELVTAALRRQVSRYRRSPRTVDELLDILANDGPTGSRTPRSPSSTILPRRPVSLTCSPPWSASRVLRAQGGRQVLESYEMVPSKTTFAKVMVNGLAM